MIIDCRTCRHAGHASCMCGDSDVLKDGQSIRVSTFLADSTGSVQISDYAQQRGVSEAQAAYEMRIGDAWKHQVHAADKAVPQPHFGGAAPVATAPVVTGDNGQAAYEKRLADAWKPPAA